MSRVILVHGWGGSPDNDWFPWVTKKLQEKGYEVVAPVMPDNEHPKIETWIPKLAEIVGQLRNDDILIGHSIGCQAILRYLTSLDRDEKVNKVILVAPWGASLSNLDDNEDREIAKPWFETPINFNKAKTKANSFVAIFSDNDPYVPFNENSKVFKENLNAKIVLKKNRAHFHEGAGVTELPELFDEL
jgi:uncharacterized protein